MGILIDSDTLTIKARPIRYDKLHQNSSCSKFFHKMKKCIGSDKLDNVLDLSMSKIIAKKMMEIQKPANKMNKNRDTTAVANQTEELGKFGRNESDSDSD